MVHPWLRLVILFSPLLLGFDALAQEKAKEAKQAKKIFRAGAFAQNITPEKFPISVNGGMTDRQAVSAHDPLHARCLVLDDGGIKIAIVVCDSCLMPRELIDEAKQLIRKQTGIPPERVLICATHTHTAPTLKQTFQSEPNEAYRQFVIRKIAAGVVEADRRLAPAKIGWGVGQDPTQVFNRRWKVKPGSLLLQDPFGKGTDKVRMNPGYQHPNLIEPAGPTDPDVSFISVRSAEGRPVAFLANYSLHYVGGVPALSADYFGNFAEKMKARLGGGDDFVGIMCNGTSGDINNVNFARPGLGKQAVGEQARIVAESVSAAAFAAYQKIQHHDWVPLRTAQKEIELGVRLPTAAEVNRAEEILKTAKGPILKTQKEIYARETVLLAKHSPRVKLVLQAIRIGELGIAALPCETFVETGLALKRKSPLRPTFTIELANGHNGYLPTPEQHALGGYETWPARSSYLEEQASVTITAELLNLLTEVRKP